MGCGYVDFWVSLGYVVCMIHYYSFYVVLFTMFVFFLGMSRINRSGPFDVISGVVSLCGFEVFYSFC